MHETQADLRPRKRPHFRQDVGLTRQLHRVLVQRQFRQLHGHEEAVPDDEQGAHGAVRLAEGARQPGGVGPVGKRDDGGARRVARVAGVAVHER